MEELEIVLEEEGNIEEEIELISEIIIVENLTNELTEQNNLIATQETTIDDIILALEGKATGGIVPEGNLDVTENGEYDVFEKATVTVDVPVGVFPEGTLDINANDEYDVVNYEKVNVNVPIPEGYVKPEGNLDIVNTDEYDVTNYATAKIKDDNLKPENIAENVEVLGLKGTFKGGVDTSDATATAFDMARGKTAYVKGEKITGLIPMYGANETVEFSQTTDAEKVYQVFDQVEEDGNTFNGLVVEQPVKDFYFLRIGASIKTTVDEDLVAKALDLTPDKIQEGVTVLGVNGTFKGGVDTSDATATSDDLLLGKTAYVNEQKITGTIETYDYSNSEAVNVTNPFRDFMGGEKTTITKEDTEGVTNFPAYILYTNNTITSVELADTVLKTGQRAFSQASKLTSVKLPQNLQELGAYAFTQTTGITEIELPDTLKSIGGNAFQGTPIKSIIIPDSVTSSIASCCLNCTNLEYAKLGNGITTVGASAFSGCSNLKTVILGSSTSFISGSMFLNCTSLETITLPPTVKTISTQSFDGCTALKEIICLAENPPTLSANSFNKVPDDCIFRVPSTSVDKYKAATNWSTRADNIVAYEGGN